MQLHSCAGDAGAWLETGKVRAIADDSQPFGGYAGVGIDFLMMNGMLVSVGAGMDILPMNGIVDGEEHYNGAIIQVGFNWLR